MYHNWLEVQVFAADRQLELLRLARAARNAARRHPEETPRPVAEITPAERTAGALRRAG